MPTLPGEMDNQNGREAGDNNLFAAQVAPEAVRTVVFSVQRLVVVRQQALRKHVVVNLQDLDGQI